MNEYYVTNLIHDNFKYQSLLKNETDKLLFLQGLYNTTVTSLNETIKSKENEINTLKQKLYKVAFDSGSYIARNNVLINEKTKLEEKINELNLKYEENQLKINNIKEELVNTINMYYEQNNILKEQLENEKNNFIELQKYLQKSYEEIYELKNTTNNHS